MLNFHRNTINVFCTYYHRLGKIIAFLCVCMLSVAASAQERDKRQSSTENSPIIIAQIDFRQTQDSATLSMLVSKSAKPLVRYQSDPDPDRIVMEWQNLTFQLNAANASALERIQLDTKKIGLINTLRYGLVAPQRSRMIIELNQFAQIDKIEIQDHESGVATILTIKIIKTDKQVFQQLVRDSPPSLPLKADTGLRPTVNLQDPRTVIVLDPGHGGIDSGAIAASGVFEKTIVFDFAKALKSELEASGVYRVVMTRDTDIFIPLDERVKIARENQASLLISIHADSLSGTGAVRGATVYTRSERATDAEAEQLASKENLVDIQAGSDIVPQAEVEEVGGILADLTRRETHILSQKAARNIVEGIGDTILLNKNAHRSARFVVLKSYDIPSVLIELGYLSSKEDVAQLQSQAWRQKASHSLKRAIEAYLTQVKISPKQ